MIDIKFNPAINNLAIKLDLWEEIKAIGTIEVDSERLDYFLNNF